jgi:hypothetical protein
LFHICQFETTIQEIWRLEIAYALIDHEKFSGVKEEFKIGYKALDIVSFNIRNSTNISTNCKIEAFMRLNSGMPSLKRVYLYIFDFLTNIDVSPAYKYKIIKKFCNNDDETEEYRVSEKMIEYCLSTFIHNKINYNDPEQELEFVKFKILTCQLCMAHRASFKSALIAEHELINVVKNIVYPTNVRADAADMLLSHSQFEENKNIAKETLEALSFDFNSTKTIYHNKENVHSETINKTSLNTILSLLTKDEEPYH